MNHAMNSSLYFKDKHVFQRDYVSFQSLSISNNIGKVLTINVIAPYQLIPNNENLNEQCRKKKEMTPHIHKPRLFLTHML